MDKNQELMRESMQKQFSASSRIIAEVTEKLTKLDDTNRRVVDVASELKTLQNVLQNPKQRGVLGEYYLDQVLKNVLPPIDTSRSISLRRRYCRRCYILESIRYYLSIVSSVWRTIIGSLKHGKAGA